MDVSCCLLECFLEHLMKRFPRRNFKRVSKSLANIEYLENYFLMVEDF